MRPKYLGIKMEITTRSKLSLCQFLDLLRQDELEVLLEKHHISFLTFNLYPMLQIQNEPGIYQSTV